MSAASAGLVAAAALIVAALGILYIRLSRAFALQMLMLLALGGFVCLAAVGYALIGHVLGSAAPPIQLGFVVGAAVTALVTLLSPASRAAIKVQVAKNLFAHRYDYRSEWLRFTETLGRPADDTAALDKRVVKAIADITESTGGLLLGIDEGGLVVQTAWRWADAAVPPNAGGVALARYLESTGRIVELDALRRADPALDQEAALVPEWMIADERAWALVPLLHFGQLRGAVLVARPLAKRALDWEDFDLLRVVGRQAASYLAEAHGQEALSEARRFDEFNRRFAFIMHDVKNLVSQLSLVARNAERHADNPQFRADMIATLQSSVGKLNALLARLSQHNKAKPEEPRPISAKRMIEAIAAHHAPRHPVVAIATDEPMMLADPARLEQALGHLVQNAIDASPPGEPVVLKAVDQGDEIAIEVHDRGVGMSQEFVRTSLFRAFTSSKETGFGVGAFEARALVAAMNGRIEVLSREGAGSVFTVTLPAATAHQSPDSPHDSKVLESQ